MSTSALPTPYSSHRFPFGLLPASTAPASPARAAIAPIVRRRATREQGMALEVIGHAIEYLVDSRMYLVHQAATRADGEAVSVLMRLSREVYASCQEITPVGLRLSRRLANLFPRSHRAAQHSVR